MLCPLKNKLHEEIANRYTSYVFNAIILPNINPNIINREVLSTAEREKLFNTFDSIVSNNQLVIDSLVESGFFSKYKKIVGYDNYKETIQLLKDKNDIKYTYDVMDRILLLYKLKSFKGKMNLLDGLSIKTDVESIKSFVLENKITNEGIGVFSALHDYGLLDDGAELVEQFIKDTGLQDIVYHDIMNRSLPFNFKMKVAAEPFFERHGVNIEVLDDETFFDQLQKILANSPYPYIVGDAQYIASKNAFFLKDANTNTVKIVIRESKFNEDILSHELGHLIVDFIYNEDRAFYEELKEFFKRNYSEQYWELFDKNKMIYNDDTFFAELETIQELLDRFISNTVDEQGNIVIDVRHLNIFDKVFYYLKKIVLMVLGYYYNERYDTDILAETLDVRLFLHKKLKEIVSKLNEIGYISPISNVNGSYILFNSGNTENPVGLANICKTVVKWYNESLRRVVHEITKGRNIQGNEETVIEVIKKGIVDLYKTEVLDRTFSFAAVSQQNRILMNYLNKDEMKIVYKDIFKSAIMREYNKDFNIYFGEVFTTAALYRFRQIPTNNAPTFSFGNYQLGKFYTNIQGEITPVDVQKVGHFRLLLAFTVIRKYREKLTHLKDNTTDVADKDVIMSKNYNTDLMSTLDTAIEILEKYENEYLKVLEAIAKKSGIPVVSSSGSNRSVFETEGEKEPLKFVYEVFYKTLTDNRTLSANDFDSFLNHIDKSINDTLLSSMDVLTLESKGNIKEQMFGLNTPNVLFVLSTALNLTKAIVSYGNSVESVVYGNKAYNIADIYNPASFNVVLKYDENSAHKNILDHILSIDVNLHISNQREKQISSYKSIVKVIEFDDFYNLLHGYDTRENLTSLPLSVRLAFSMNDKDMMYEIVNPVDSFVNTQLVISLLNVVNNTSVEGELAKIFKQGADSGVASELNNFLLSTIFESYFSWNKGSISKENITYEIDNDSIFLLALDMTLGFLERLRNEKRGKVKVEGIVLVFLNYISNIDNISDFDKLEKDFNKMFKNLTYNKSIDERSVYFKTFDVDLNLNVEIHLTTNLSELLQKVVDKIDDNTLRVTMNSKELKSLMDERTLLDLSKVKSFIEALNDEKIGYKYLEKDTMWMKIQGVATYNKISSTLLLNLIYKSIKSETLRSIRENLKNFLNDKQAYVYRSPITQHYPLLWDIIVDRIWNNAATLNSSKIVGNGVEHFRYGAEDKENTHTLVDKVSHKNLEQYSIEELLDVGLNSNGEKIEEYRKRQYKGPKGRDILFNLVLDSIPMKVKENGNEVIGASKYGLNIVITYNVYSDGIKEVKLNLAYLYHTYSDLNRTIFTLNERFNETLHDRFKKLIQSNDTLKKVTQTSNRLNIADVLEIAEELKKISNSNGQLVNNINVVFKALVENTIAYYQYMQVVDKINDDFYSKQIALLRSIVGSNNLLFNFIYLLNQLSTVEVPNNLFKSQLEMVDLVNANQKLTLDDYDPYDTVFGLSISDDFKSLLKYLNLSNAFYDEFYNMVNKYFSTKLFKKVLDFKVITDVFNTDNIGLLKDNVVVGKITKELYTKRLSEKLSETKTDGSSNIVLSGEKNILKMLTNTSYSKFRNQHGNIVSIKSEYDKDNRVKGNDVFEIAVNKFYTTYKDKLDIMLNTVKIKVKELYERGNLSDSEKKLIEKFYNLSQQQNNQQQNTNNNQLLKLLLFDSKYFYNLLLSIRSKKGSKVDTIDDILKYSSLVGSLFNSYVKKETVVESIISNPNFTSKVNGYQYYTRSKLYEDIYEVKKSSIDINNKEDLLKTFNQIIEAYLVYPKFTYGAFLEVVKNLQNKKGPNNSNINKLYNLLFGLYNLIVYDVETYITNSNFETLIEGIFSDKGFEELENALSNQSLQHTISSIPMPTPQEYFENIINTLLDQIPSDYNIYIDGGNSLFGNVFDVGLLDDSAREGESFRDKTYNLYGKIVSQFSNLYLKDEFLYTIHEASIHYQGSYVTGKTLYKDDMWSLNFTNNYSIINQTRDTIERKKQIIKNYLKLFNHKHVNITDAIRNFFDEINKRSATRKFGYEYPVVSKTDDILHNVLHQLFNLTTRDLNNHNNFYKIFDKFFGNLGIFQNVGKLLDYDNIDSTYDAHLMLKSYPTVLKKLVEIFEFLNNIEDISLLDAYSIKDETKTLYNRLRNGSTPLDSDLDMLTAHDSMFLLGLFKKLGILSINNADDLINRLKDKFLKNRHFNNVNWQYFFIDFFDSRGKKTILNQYDFDSYSSELLVDDIKSKLNISELTLDQYALLLILVDLDSKVTFSDTIKTRIVREILGSNVSNPVDAYNKIENIVKNLDVKVNPNRVSFSTLGADRQESTKYEYVLTFYEILNYLHNAALNLDSGEHLYSLSKLLSTVVRDIKLREAVDIGGRNQESKLIISIFNKVHILTSNKKVDNIGDKVKEIFNTSLAYNYKLIEIGGLIETVGNVLMGIYFDADLIYPENGDTEIDVEIKNTILNAFTDIINHIYESTVKKSMEKVNDLEAVTSVLFSDSSPIKLAPLNFNDFDPSVFKKYRDWKWGDDTVLNNLNAMTVNNDDSSAEMMNPHLNSITNLVFAFVNSLMKLFKNRRTNEDENKKIINIFAKTEPYNVGSTVVTFNKVDSYISGNLNKRVVNLRYILNRFSKEYDNTLQYNNPINTLEVFETRERSYADYLLGLAKKYIEHLNLRPSIRLTTLNNFIITIFTGVLYVFISYALGSMLLSITVVHLVSNVVRSFADVMDSKGAIDFLKNFVYRFIYLAINDVRAVITLLRDLFPIGGDKVTNLIKRFESVFLPVSTETVSKLSSAIEGSKGEILEMSAEINAKSQKGKQPFAQRIKNVGFASVLGNVLLKSSLFVVAIPLKAVYSIMSNMLEIKNRFEEGMHRHVYSQVILKYQLFGHYIKDLFDFDTKNGNVTLNEKGLKLLVDIIKNDKEREGLATQILKEFQTTFEGVDNNTTLSNLKAKLKSIPFTRFVSLSPIRDIIGNSVLSQLYYTFYSAYIGSEFLDVKTTQLSGMFRFLFLMLTTVIHLLVGLFNTFKYVITLVPIYGIINYFIDNKHLLEKVTEAITNNRWFEGLNNTIEYYLKPALHDLSDNIYNIKYQPILDFVNDFFTITSDPIRYEGAYYGIVNFIRQLGGYAFHPLFYLSTIPMVYLISKALRDKRLSWFSSKIYTSRKKLMLFIFTFILTALLSYNTVYTVSTNELYFYDKKVSNDIKNPEYTTIKGEIFGRDWNMLSSRQGINVDESYIYTYRILRVLDTTYNKRHGIKDNVALGLKLKEVFTYIDPNTKKETDDLEHIVVSKDSAFNQVSIVRIKRLRDQIRTTDELNYILSNGGLLSQEMIHLGMTGNIKLALEALANDTTIFNECDTIHKRTDIDENKKKELIGNIIYNHLDDKVDPRLKEVIVTQDLFPLVYASLVEKVPNADVFSKIVNNYKVIRLNQLDQDYVSVDFIKEAFSKLTEIKVSDINLYTDAYPILSNFLGKYKGNAQFISQDKFVDKMKNDPEFRKVVFNGLGYIFDRKFPIVVNVIFNIKLPPQAFGIYYVPLEIDKRTPVDAEDISKLLAYFDDYSKIKASKEVLETASRVVTQALEKDKAEQNRLLATLQSKDLNFVLRPSLFYTFVKNFKNELRNPLHSNFYKVMDGVDRWFYDAYVPTKQEPEKKEPDQQAPTPIKD